MTALTGFAEACYDTNSISELLAAKAAPNADETDCETWAITPVEWYAAISAALAEKFADNYEEFSEYIDPDATTTEVEFDAMGEDARVAMIAEVLALNDTRRFV